MDKSIDVQLKLLNILGRASVLKSIDLELLSFSSVPNEVKDLLSGIKLLSSDIISDTNILLSSLGEKE
jgi:hypothetical protein